MDLTNGLGLCSVHPGEQQHPGHPARQQRACCAGCAHAVDAVDSDAPAAVHVVVLGASAARTIVVPSRTVLKQTKKGNRQGRQALLAENQRNAKNKRESISRVAIAQTKTILGSLTF